MPDEIMNVLIKAQATLRAYPLHNLVAVGHPPSDFQIDRLPTPHDRRARPATQSFGIASWPNWNQRSDFGYDSRANALAKTPDEP